MICIKNVNGSSFLTLTMCWCCFKGCKWIFFCIFWSWSKTYLFTPKFLSLSGVCVDGRNYDYITSNARMLHAQIGPYGVLFSRFDGLHTYKTGQILILCVCEDRFCLVGPSTIFVNQALLTQKFGEYLIQAGF